MTPCASARRKLSSLASDARPAGQTTDQLNGGLNQDSEGIMRPCGHIGVGSRKLPGQKEVNRRYSQGFSLRDSLLTYGKPDDSEPGSSGPRLKLVRLIDKHDLEGIGAELEQRWTADDEARASLRELAADFNKELLSTAMTETGRQPLDGEVDNVYRHLTTDDLSEGERTRMRRRLEREGVDVEQLRSEFVTYQAVRTYLMKYRAAKYSEPDRDRTAEGAEHIQLPTRGRKQARLPTGKVNNSTGGPDRTGCVGRSE